MLIVTKIFEVFSLLTKNISKINPAARIPRIALNDGDDLADASYYLFLFRG